MVRSRGRRRVVVAVLLAVGIAVGVSGSAGAFEATQVPAKWDVAGVGLRSRSLELVYTTSGCLGPGVHASVQEAATSVTIVVEEDATIPGSGQACPLYLGSASTTVQLSSPLAGRAILGRPAAGYDGVPLGAVDVGSDLEISVPRLSGFDPADARHTLALYRLHESVRVAPRRRPGLVRVLSQTPAAGTAVAQASTVRILISRH
jgi:hypothetical protein